MAMAGTQAGQLRGRGELGSWGAGWDPPTHLLGGSGGWRQQLCMWLPLLDSVPKSKPRCTTGRSPSSAPADPGLVSTAAGGNPGEGVSPHTLRENAKDGEGAGLSPHRSKAGSELPHHRLPSQPRHIPRIPDRSDGGSTGEAGRIPGKPRGQLWKAPGSWAPVPTPPAPQPHSSSSGQCVPWLRDQHWAHLYITFCFPNQGHSEQQQYLSKLAKQPGWKLA